MATQNWFRSLQSGLSLSVASPGRATMIARRDAQIKPKMGLEEGLAKKTEMAEHLPFLQRKQFLANMQTWALAEDARSGLVQGEMSHFLKQGSVTAKGRGHRCAVFGEHRCDFLGSHCSAPWEAELPLCQPGPRD